MSEGETKLRDLDRHPQVTVILMCYNHERWISESLRSLFSQTYLNFNLLIFDDASTDSSQHNIRDLMQTVSRPNVFLHLQTRHRGLPYIQSLIKEVYQDHVSKYLCYCEGDDYWGDSRLQEQVHFMEEHDSCSVSFHNVLKINRDGNVIGGFYPDNYVFTGKQRDMLAHGPVNVNTGTMYRMRGDLVEDASWWHAIDYCKTVRLLDDSSEIRYLPRILGAYRVANGVSNPKHPLRRIYTDLAHLNACNEFFVRYPEYAPLILKRYVNCLTKLGLQVGLSEQSTS